jgi:hypothetical protein
MDASILDALTIMQRHDYSQLPIVDADKKQQGIVTAESILRTQKNLGAPLGKLKVQHAAKSAAKSAPDDNIFDVFELFYKHPAVLVVDSDDVLMGIITPWDAAAHLQRRAEDLMLIEDIESAIKEHILASFTDRNSGVLLQELLDTAISNMVDHSEQTLKDIMGSLKKYLAKAEVSHNPKTEIVQDAFDKLINQNRQNKSFNELTLNQYIELLLQGERWNAYGQTFSLDAEFLRKLLMEVRDIRNQLAHFRDEINEDQRGLLRYCRDLFERHPVPEITLVTKPIDDKTLNDPLLSVEPTEDELAPGESRYARLSLHLQQLPMKQQREELAFEEVEKILEGGLPASAWQHRSWWANDSVSHVQSQQWLDAGWRVAKVNLTERKVSFVRAKERETAYIEFFSRLLSNLREKADFPIRPRFPTGTSWHTIGWYENPEGVYTGTLGYSFARTKQFRVELYIDTGEKTQNKNMFDVLSKEIQAVQDNLNIDYVRAAINQVPMLHTSPGTGSIPDMRDIHFERLDDRRASRIAIYNPGSITDSEEELEQLQQAAVIMMIVFYKLLTPIMAKYDLTYRG